MMGFDNTGSDDSIKGLAPLLNSNIIFICSINNCIILYYLHLIYNIKYFIYFNKQPMTVS